jgi:hypothetical protein
MQIEVFSGPPSILSSEQKRHLAGIFPDLPVCVNGIGGGLMAQVIISYHTGSAVTVARGVGL